jgi:hypothetical protein
VRIFASAGYKSPALVAIPALLDKKCAFLKKQKSRGNICRINIVYSSIYLANRNVLFRGVENNSQQVKMIGLRGKKETITRENNFKNFL